MIFIGIRDDCGIEPSHPSAQQRPIILRDALESVVIDYEERTKLLDAGQRYASYARWRELKPGQRVSDLTGIRGFSGIKLDPSAIAPTILKSEGELQLYGAMHWQEQRRPLRAEYKRIASFPDEFAFVGPIGNAIERIGNSVPPLFMRAVAEHIRTKILAQVPAIAIRETVSHA
jgi:DNA (cytosine-5)-methyltransferase 1